MTPTQRRESVEKGIGISDISTSDDRKKRRRTTKTGNAYRSKLVQVYLVEKEKKGKVMITKRNNDVRGDIT